jgi:S-formylglutathione hydrolase FrmB
VGAAARVSLIDGWFPHAVVVLAVATLVAGLWTARARWRRLGGVAVAVTAAMAAAAVLIARLDLSDYTWPKSFYAWVGIALFAGGVASLGWRRSAWWSRLVAVGSVAVTLAMAATLINQHYAYFPTPASLFGQVAVDEVPASHVLAPKPAAAARKVPTADEANPAAVLADAPAPAPAAARQAVARQPRRTHGAVITVDLPARRSGFVHREAVVYLPPAWFSSPRPELPVIMMLTGTPSLVSDWTRAAHADQIADEYAAAHHGWAPILVFPDPNGSNLGDTECVDSPLGHAETYLTDDVPADVVALFGSEPAPWAVAGLSEGGMCAALLTARHPDVFSAFADFSGEPGPIIGHDRAATMRLLFGGSKDAWRDHDPLTLLSRRRFDGHGAWFEVGADDRGPLVAAKRLDAAATRAGMATHLVIRPGQHNFTFWSESFRHALPWLAARLTGGESPALSSVASGP